MESQLDALLMLLLEAPSLEHLSPQYNHVNDLEFLDINISCFSLPISSGHTAPKSLRYADTTSQSRLRYDLVGNVIYLLLELDHIPRRSMSFSTKNIHPC